MSQSEDMAMPSNGFEELIAPEVEVPKTVNARAAFMSKCLHPPSAVNGFEGLPTNDTRSQVTAEYKGLFLSQSSGYVQPDGTCVPPTAKPTSFAFLIPGGGLKYQAFAFFKDTTNGSWFQDVPNTIINNVYDVSRVCFDVNLYRPTYKSITQSLNTTMFNNTGMVVGNSFNPPLIWAGSFTEFADKHPAMFRDFIRYRLKNKPTLVRRSRCKYFHNFPASVKMDVLEVVKQSMTSRSRPTKDDDEDLSDYTEIALNLKIDSVKDEDPLTLDLDPSAKLQFVYFGEAAAGQGNLIPVPTMDQMLNNDTRSATYPAREGAFVVSRLNTIAPRWLVPTNGMNSVNGLFECYFAFYDPDGQYHFNALFDRGELKTKPDNARDIQWAQDMTWSWVQYQGLSYNSNQDAVTQQQLLATKFIAGYEFQPAYLSPFAGMQHLSPKPDLMAMEELLREFYEFKSILPAKYNFLGMLARGAAKLLPFITKHSGTIMKGIKDVASFGDSETRRDAQIRNSAVRPKKNKVKREKKKENRVLAKVERDIKANRPAKAVKEIKKEIARPPVRARTRSRSASAPRSGPRRSRSLTRTRK